MQGVLLSEDESSVKPKLPAGGHTCLGAYQTTGPT